MARRLGYSGGAGQEIKQIIELQLADRRVSQSVIKANIRPSALTLACSQSAMIAGLWSPALAGFIRQVGVIIIGQQRQRSDVDSDQAPYLVLSASRTPPGIGHQIASGGLFLRRGEESLLSRSNQCCADEAAGQMVCSRRRPKPPDYDRLCCHRRPADNAFDLLKFR